MKILILILIAVASVSTDKARFDNYRVYKLFIENSKQLEALKILAETSDAYNFWEHPMKTESNVELVVPPHKFAEFDELMEKLKVRNELLVSNLQEQFDKEERRMSRRKDAGVMNWEDYQDVETIHNWLDSLQQQFPNFVTVSTIGLSYEGRPLKLLKLSKKTGNRAIFVESHIHSREWIASATSTWIINELLTSTRAETRDLSENVDWYFLVITNPDGYEYSRKSNRLWRKTRSEHSILCYGSDPNRNFGFNWMVPDEFGTTGTSSSPCSDLYPGPYPFSEPECAAIDKYLDEHKGIFDAYLALHSYDHSILYPYGNSRTPVPNADELQAVGEAAIARLESKHGLSYRVGAQPIILYAASGNSQDHAYGKYGIPISYTYEMRGVNMGGFVLPPEHIIPNAEEVWESFIGLVQKAREFGRFPINRP